MTNDTQNKLNEYKMTTKKEKQIFLSCFNDSWEKLVNEAENIEYCDRILPDSLIEEWDNLPLSWRILIHLIYQRLKEGVHWSLIG
jgi:hypothetical protein